MAQNKPAMSLKIYLRQERCGSNMQSLLNGLMPTKVRHRILIIKSKICFGLEYFKSNQKMFERLDNMRSKLNQAVLHELTREMQARMTHQSISIEGNILSLTDVTKIEKQLQDTSNSIIEEYTAIFEGSVAQIDPANFPLPAPQMLLAVCLISMQ